MLVESISYFREVTTSSPVRELRYMRKFQLPYELNPNVTIWIKNKDKIFIAKANRNSIEMYFYNKAVQFLKNNSKSYKSILMKFLPDFGNCTKNQ